MNNNLKNHYQNVIVYDLLTKSNIKNIFEITKITKICLNIGFKNANIEKKKLINILVLLKLITNQKPIVTKSKKNNIFLKIKKNSIIGCKVTLRKKNIYEFLEKILIFIIPNLNKNINLNLENKNILNFQIKNILNFFELRKEFLKFKEIPPIDVSIHTNSKNNKELFNILNSYFIIKK
uniref:50S ribosomal protein L5, chloroplastic n=1 Tax=Pythium insidiosum TaxID=114742 RepID=A0A0K2SSA3_PYTIN|nr:ribosomal protein L5 [Pythium insidiosum]YP_009167056.1 ribosomal protein L5 [Pythium insidiosum]BAS30599.1 ribosomal protein L5 [Pythium insidiosum]BAS30617.1 ribosomal protein L5 [Pythium insidiosum]